jgi:heme exporter protein A
MSVDGPFQDKPALRADALTLVRGGRTLFEGLSFAAKPGGYVEIRGANGAGKTSLLRVIAGFLKPRAGGVFYENVEEPATALHYVGHPNALKPNASVREHLRYWAGLFGGDARNPDALVRLGLAGLEERLARTLSQGQARRLALARLLIAPRPIWLLDEPGAGLDADGHAMAVDLIAQQRERGGVVLAALHEPLRGLAGLTVTLGQT